MSLPTSFSIGPDAHVYFIWRPTGLQVPASAIGHLMEFSAEQQVETQKIVPITDGGRSVNQNIYTGWDGTINFTRVNGSLTAIFATEEQNYYAGQRSHWDIMVDVSNKDGTIDEYLFSLVSFNRGQFGAFQTRNPVEQSLGFVARTMYALSGTASAIPAAA